MKQVFNDRDQVIIKHIVETDIDHANAHLGEEFVKKNYVFKNPHIDWKPTEKYRIAMIIAPSWGVYFPPYNIAKLTGLLRHYDYSTKVYDLNVECYHHLIKETGKDYWRGENYHYWISRESFDEILPIIKPLLETVIEEIVESKPKIIGMSLYTTNVFCSEYIIKRLRDELPDACYLAGGPETVTMKHRELKDYFNYVFVGESEANLINLVENLPEEYPQAEFIGTTDSRLQLDKFPYPDYSDYLLTNYLHQDGVSIETSRGCVALCSFCSETHFWKFRSIDPDRVLDELKHQSEVYKISRFWIVDSLINGNLKHFERLLDLIIDNKLNIKWNSYARCDGRMTAETFKKIVASGCTCLSYGVESGSQKVLYDMRKKIDIWEIEDNLRDGKVAGLFNHVNWVIGFPTELPIDYLHSLILLYNCRKTIGAISPGFGAGIAKDTDMETNWKTYNIVAYEHAYDNGFLGQWYTTDFDNTALHRMMRIKFCHIWLKILKDHCGSTAINSHEFETLSTFYDFSTESEPSLEKLDYDEYIDLFLAGRETLQEKIVAEYFCFSYALYKIFGTYSIEINFSPALDFDTFGENLGNDYTAVFNISVHEGNFYFRLKHELKHIGLNEDREKLYEREREKQDMSFKGNFIKQGRFGNFLKEEIQIGETVHSQYKKKAA